MMGLWADGWFYISSAGLLVSGILFFFLLGQYRVASEAADATEGEQGAEKEASAPAVVRPVYIPDDAPSPRVASHAEPKPEAKAEAPKPKAEEAPRRDPATSTGGISPAVVYLQNIKIELADLHKDLRSLAKRVDDELSSVSTRDEALIERLGELTRAVEGFKAAAAVAAAEAEPAPKRTRKAEKAAPAPAPEPEPAPAPEPVKAAEPARAEPAEVVIEVMAPPAPDAIPEIKPAAISPDETIRMDLSALVAAPQRAPEPAAEPAPAPAPEPAPAPAPEEKPRRGPVWPV